MCKVLEFAQHFTEAQLILVNQCRIFLRVMYVSDMTSGDGKFIEECFIQGTRPIDRRSQWKWLYQHRPSKEAWVQWRKALGLVWKIDASNRNCDPKLGKWRPQKFLNMTWFFSYDTDTNLVYRKHCEVWENYKLISEMRNCSIFELCSSHLTPGTSAQRISVFKMENNKIYTSGYSGCISSQRYRSFQTDDWWEWTIHKAQLKDIELLDNTYICCPVRKLKDMIINNLLHIVCDGSFFPEEKVATAAFVIEDCSLREMGRGYCRVTGGDVEIGPYRAEVGGIHLVLHVLKAICSECKITNGSVTIHCDCEAAVKMMHRHPDTITVSTKHHDILWDITYMIQHLPLKIKFAWIKGHQSTDMIQTNQLAKMNDTVDGIAKKYAKYCIQHPTEQSSIVYGNSYWNVECNGMRIVNAIDKRIVHHVHAIDLFDHLQEKYDLNDSEITSIDWVAIARAMNQLTLAEKLWTTKHVSHFNGLGKKMMQSNQWESAKCPRCLYPVENHIHLITCPHESCQLIMGQSLLRISKTLKKWKTQPLIQLLI